MGRNYGGVRGTKATNIGNYNKAYHSNLSLSTMGLQKNEINEFGSDLGGLVKAYNDAYNENVKAIKVEVKQVVDNWETLDSDVKAGIIKNINYVHNAHTPQDYIKELKDFNLESIRLYKSGKARRKIIEDNNMNRQSYESFAERISRAEGVLEIEKGLKKRGIKIK